MIHEIEDGIMIDIPKGILWDEEECSFSSIDESVNIHGKIHDIDLDDYDDWEDIESFFEKFLASITAEMGIDPPKPTFIKNKCEIGFALIPMAYNHDEDVARIVAFVAVVQFDENIIVFHGNAGWRLDDEEGNLQRLSLLLKIFRGITLDGEKLSLNSFTPSKIQKKYIAEDSFLLLESESAKKNIEKSMINLPKLVFSDAEIEIFDANLIVPIPNGFEAHVNEGYINNAGELIIAPEDYDDLENYFDAPFVLTLQKIPTKSSKDNPINKHTVNLYEALLWRINAFASDASVMRFGFRDGFIAFAQNFVDFDDPTYNKLKGYICTDNGIYQVALTCNHSYDASDDTVINYFVEITSAWIEKFRIVGEKNFRTFPKATPDSSLYSFYNEIMSMKKKNASLGVLFRTSGFNYEFIPLIDEIKNRGFSLETKDAEESVFKLFEETDHEYTLWQKAEKMARAFRVSKQAFNSQNDRECALMKGLVRDAYMLSAFRSFAWTVEAYCREENLDPEDLTIDDIRDIISFIEGREWLNYNGEKYSKSICGCNDINVVYTTTKISPIILLGFMGEFIDCSSLNDLRDDLEYIAPSIKLLYEYLLNNRDINIPLEGNEADILYMWCVMAIAAKSPFYIGNGPSTCVFEQIIDGENDKTLTSNAKVKEKSSKTKDAPAKENISTHVKSNIKYVQLTPDDVLVADGELLEYNGNEKNVILPEGIIEIGRTFASSVLFENVIIPEGVIRIGEEAFSGQYRMKSVSLPSTLKVIAEYAFEGCLLLEDISFPYGLDTIEQSAFSSCDSLKMIVIPETVKSIGDSIFDNCSHLKDVYLHVNDSEVFVEDSFFGMNYNSILHIKFYENIKEYCENNYINYDYESVEDYVPIQDIVVEKSSKSDFVIEDFVLKSYKGCARIVEVPGGVKEIERCTFSNHHEIEKIIISDGVERIGAASFSYCISLNEIIIPKTLKFVEDVAFYNCISLKKISFAPGLETLGRGLFHSNTQDIYLPATVINIDKNAFYAFDGATLHVPSGSVAETYAKENGIKFDHESDPMMQKYDEEAECKAREEAERKAREEAERKVREEAERKAREEAERKAREEAERKVREEAERKAREEAERKAREEAERKAREEAERKAREEAEHKAREEAECKAREEAERKAREEVARLEQENIRAERRIKNLCQHCGGKLKGLFTKKCSVCGKKKDY